MPVVHEERNNEASRQFFREHMGKGVGTIYKPPPGWLETKPSEQQDNGQPASQPQTREEEIAEIVKKAKEADQQLFNEASPWSYCPSDSSQNSDELQEQDKLNMSVIEAYKRGDRIGANFEGGCTFQPVNESRLQLALNNQHGTDESSIVDCFLAYSERYPWDGDSDSWLWGWLEYHMHHHGRGYGRTMRNHFALVKYLVKNSGHLSTREKLDKVKEISAETNSFGNGSLCLVYPLYQYAKANICQHPPRDTVLTFTRYTHVNVDAIKAVNLLMDIIDGAPVEPPSEEYLREHRMAERATAYNTLLTALFIADVETEMDVIRRGVYVGGDTDSTLATAMLLWALKHQ